MKPIWHVVVASVFIPVTIFLVFIWYVSGNNCEYSPCVFVFSGANLTFLSMGFLTAFLAAIELMIALMMVRQENEIYESKEQRKTWVRGITLILVGIPLLVFGLYFDNTTMIMCPAFPPGCSWFDLFLTYAPFLISFYLGLGLVAIGDTMILRSKFRLVKLPREDLLIKKVDSS